MGEGECEIKLRENKQHIDQLTNQNVDLEIKIKELETMILQTDTALGFINTKPIPDLFKLMIFSVLGFSMSVGALASIALVLIKYHS